LYILAGTMGALALVSIVLSFTNIAQQPGSPGDASLWRMTSIALLCVALVVTLAGVLSSLFEQAERRHEEQRRRQREARKK
jgi:hypothetical protein